MTNTHTPTLFENAPAIATSNTRTKDAWQAKIDYKLNVFFAAGGTARQQTVPEYQLLENPFAFIQPNKNNCFSSVLGFDITGDGAIDPGTLSFLEQDPSNPKRMFFDNKDNVLPEYESVWKNVQKYDAFLQDNLQKDGIVKDIPIDSVADYYPVICFSYNIFYFDPYKDYAMDYHFLAAHANQDDKGKAVYSYSSRNGRSGPPEFFMTTRELVTNLERRDSYRADVYFASKSYMGLEVDVKDQGAADLHQDIVKRSAVHDFNIVYKPIR